MSMSRLVTPVRLLAAAAAVLVGAAISIGGAIPAHAVTTVSAGPFVACPDYNNLSSETVGHGCQSLADALTAAETASDVYYGPVSVTLLPGDYCPFTLPLNISRGFSLVGAGAAGLSSAHASFSGYEAALTAVTWSSTHCSHTVPAYELTVPDHSTQLYSDLNIANIALIGATGGPANGLDGVNLNVNMRDDYVTGFTSGTGLVNVATGNFYTYNDSTLSIYDSAIVNNDNGVQYAAQGTIVESTVAGNSGTGISTYGYQSFYNDTISHNGIGVNAGSLIGSQVLNTLVGGNTTDCLNAGAGSKWEWDFEHNAGGSASGSANNLYGTSCTPSAANASDTFLPASPTISDLAANGGPTPTIMPPNAAMGTAEGGPCSLGGSDQREYARANLYTTCDIGAVDHAATATPAVETGENPIAFGKIPTNQTATISNRIDNAYGGSLVGVTSEAVAGSGLSVPAGACVHTMLFRGNIGDGCYVGATLKPAATGSVTGSVTVHMTSGGDFVIPVTATAVAAIPPVKDLLATPHSKAVSLSFTKPADPDGLITSWDVEQSSDGGKTWSSADVENGSNGLPATIASLTNGTAYEFKIAAYDALGELPFSTTTAPVIPHTGTDTSSLAAPSTVAIKSGSATSLSITLTDHDTSAPIAAAKVTVTGGGKTVKATTNVKGVASVPIHPAANTTYTWRYAGTSAHVATTVKVSVMVEQVVHASLSVKKVKHGKTVKIFGTVSPNQKGKTVVIQELVHGTWKSLAHPATIKSQVLPGGHGKALGFSYSYKPSKKGTETLRVSRAATAHNAAGASKDLKLTVT